MQRTSPNAPSNTTAIGSILLTILSGAIRYRHSESLRGDQITPQLLGMDRMLRVDAIRRFVEVAAASAGQSDCRSAAGNTRTSDGTGPVDDM